MAREKTTGFYFKMSPLEWEWVERRMAQTNIRNKSAFIRKMCIDGHVINLDMAGLNEIGRLLRITANNVNQIAKRANETRSIYASDVADLNEQFSGLRSDFGKLLISLSALTDNKPGKVFTPPLTWRDLEDMQNENV